MGHQMVIGISSNHKGTDRAFHRNLKDFNYGYDVFNGQKVSKNKFADYGCKCSRMDKIEMILDLNRKQLSFIVNDMMQGVAYNDIEQSKNVKYKLSICLKAKGAAIALTNYQEIISNETTQKKEEKTPKSSSKVSVSASHDKQIAEIRKLSKQLDEQRVVQQKMDKRLKNIMESLKEITKTLRIKHNTKEDDVENVNTASSNSVCSNWLKNMRIICVGIFLLLIIVFVCMYLVPQRTGKSDL